MFLQHLFQIVPLKRWTSFTIMYKMYLNEEVTFIYQAPSLNISSKIHIPVNNRYSTVAVYTADYGIRYTPQSRIYEGIRADERRDGMAAVLYAGEVTGSKQTIAILQQTFTQLTTGIYTTMEDLPGNQSWVEKRRNGSSIVRRRGNRTGSQQTIAIPQQTFTLLSTVFTPQSRIYQGIRDGKRRGRVAAVLYIEEEVTGSQSMNLGEQCAECGELRPVNIERRAVIFRRQCLSTPPPQLHYRPNPVSNPSTPSGYPYYFLIPASASNLLRDPLNSTLILIKILRQDVLFSLHLHYLGSSRDAVLLCNKEFF